MASSTQPTGIGADVENLRLLKLPHALKFFAHVSETAWWQQQPNPQEAAIQLWTQKEAAYKAYLRQDRNLTRLCITGQQVWPSDPATKLPNYEPAMLWQVDHPDEPLHGQGITFLLTEKTWVSLCQLMPKD